MLYSDDTDCKKARMQRDAINIPTSQTRSNDKSQMSPQQTHTYHRHKQFLLTTSICEKHYIAQSSKLLPNPGRLFHVELLTILSSPLLVAPIPSPLALPVPAAPINQVVHHPIPSPPLLSPSWFPTPLPFPTPALRFPLFLLRDDDDRALSVRDECGREDSGGSAKEIRFGVEFPEEDPNPKGEMIASGTLSMLKEGDGVCVGVGGAERFLRAD